MAFYEEFERLQIKLEEIKTATNNFDDNNVIGRGAFGKVYKGEISHSKGRSVVAFKRLQYNNIYGQGIPQFWGEIKMLSRYTHDNLISLLGYCKEGREKILLYEFAFHGSLDRHLHATTLTWRQRVKICLAVAKGLSYLHDPNGTQQRVLHRDIKSANILLDENWNAKLSDFGLSKFGPANQQYTGLVTDFAGTRGYCDPLYMEEYLLTKESDVYSFGVVLFEVLIGRLCFEFRNGQFEVFVQKWKQSYEQNKLSEIIIHDLFQQMDPISLKTFSDIAYKCLLRSREDRPQMADVVKQLEIALEPHKALPISDEDTDWESKLPNDYEELIKLSKDNLKWTTKKELYLLLREGFFIRNGKEWFSFDKSGTRGYLLHARAAFVESEWKWRPLSESRFGEVAYNPLKKIHITYKNKLKRWSTEFQRRYATYLVYKLPVEHSKLQVCATVRVNRSLVPTWTIYLLCHQNTHNPLDTTKRAYFPQLRTDGWMEVNLWNFQAHYGWNQAGLTLTFTNPLDGLIVQGIQFKPFESSS